MEKHKDLEKHIEAYMELQNPIHHLPANLGIKAFKREALAAGLPKKLVKKLVAAYKKRAWMEYAGIARHRGTFPSHRKYGTKIEVKIVETETEVHVRTKTN